MIEPAAFQWEAIQRICERLGDSNGSRRFLLADEVGLGKTVVARGVITSLREENRRRRRRRGMVIVYLCSSLEIAAQNSDKLIEHLEGDVDGGSQGVVTRLTLLPLGADKIRENREHGRPQLLLFTPGTSLQLGRASGVKQERRMLLACLLSHFRHKLLPDDDPWIEFFRCGASQETWPEECDRAGLTRLTRQVRRARLFDRLIRHWRKLRVDYRPPGRGDSEDRPLLEAIPQAIRDLAGDRDSRRARHNRWEVLGKLREGAARAALDFLSPDLLVLDEFQRFKDVTELAKEPDSLPARLFGTNRDTRPRMLVLSATPYKWVTFDNEKENHYDDFFKTLEFLHNGANGYDGWIEGLKRDLLDFKKHLAPKEENLAPLFDLKRRIEERLREVMSRTERNRYVGDETRFIQEQPKPGTPRPTPTADELEEYVRLRRFLLAEREEELPASGVIDFWKSCSSVVSFMDSHYALVKTLRHKRLPVDEHLLRPERALVRGAEHNLKVRSLIARLRESADVGARDRWPFLWCRPTYFYWRDAFFRGKADPTKFLVFSHWRFVPKAISFLVSGAIEASAGATLPKAPLELNTEALKVCLPLLCLAELVQPGTSAATAIKARDDGLPPTLAVVRREARRSLLEGLSKVGIAASPRAPKGDFWPALLRLEQNCLAQSGFRDGFFRQCIKRVENDLRRERSGQGTSAQDLAGTLRDWLDRADEVSAFPTSMLDRAVDVMLGSPAVCLVRALSPFFLGAEPEEREAWIADTYVLSFRGLRSYLNRSYVQAAIRRASRERRYADRVLRYAQEAHLQAVFDEYAYLLVRVQHRTSAEKLLATLERVFGLGPGMPNINVPGRGGRIREKRSQRPVHFALAFGDDEQPVDAGTGGTRQGKSTRKTAVREAFNSPFWPFTLATTSVGQEGLDFHFYCRDIVHWNLPSSPVDFEQREGRINRFDGLAVRRNMAADYPLPVAISPEAQGAALWDRIFSHVTRRPTGRQGYKHGLFPHWVFESTGGQAFPIRRHVAIFKGSRDAARYVRLKRYLSLYRLVFGQARQRDLLDQIINHPDHSRLCSELQGCMINLSPFPHDYAWREARREAEEVVKDPAALRELLADVDVLLRDRREELSTVRDEIALLRGHLERVIAGAEPSPSVPIAASLIYLRNPYDEQFDRYGRKGLEDDISIIREQAAALGLME